MNREDALTTLASESPSERLGAARILQFWALPADVPVLRGAIAKESVGWVRRALESALQRLGDRQSVTVNLDDIQADEGEISDDLSALARARITRTVVHELEPIVGAIEYYASTEFTAYGGSQTNHHVDRLAAMLRAIETLGKISNQPRLEPVDLTRLLSEIVEAERAKFEVEVRLEGPLGLTVTTDPGLLGLIASNGLRNACESVIQVDDRPTAITVLYGSTDRDAWVSVVDNGIGLPSGSTENLFGMGTSTKEDHLGMGLTLSSEAARALGGDLRLTTEAGSTRLELILSTGLGNDDANIPA